MVARTGCTLEASQTLMPECRLGLRAHNSGPCAGRSVPSRCHGARAPASTPVISGWVRVGWIRKKPLVRLMSPTASPPANPGQGMVKIHARTWAPLCRSPTTAFREDQHNNEDPANKHNEANPSSAKPFFRLQTGSQSPRSANAEARRLSVASAWTRTSGDAPGTSCRSAAGRTPPGAPAAGATQTPAAPAPPPLPARRGTTLPFVSVVEAPLHPRSTNTICRGVARRTPPGALRPHGAKSGRSSSAAAHCPQQQCAHSPVNSLRWLCVEL